MVLDKLNVLRKRAPEFSRKTPSRGAQEVNEIIPFLPFSRKNDYNPIYTAVTYPDWTTYGSAQQQSQAGDSEFQRVFAEFAKVVELQDRSVIVADDL